jgi:S1-C subfamily serine protease
VEGVRDRVLILGRRKAGKTVFLARLYEQAWRGCDGVHMRAADGPLHALCMDMVAQLKDGLWPAATVGSLAGGVEVSWRDKTATMVMLDYPGEVFRRAFVDGATDEQALDLVDHVDHAAAVIVLIDPGNVHAGDFDEVVDDDYGMVAAVDRIRRSPGGQSVPIAVALTKCDVHIGLIRAAGGARGFVQKHLPNLLRYGGSMRMFATAAVRTRRDAAGRPVPSTRHQPAGLIDTMVYCMRHVGRRMDVDAGRRADEARAAQAADLARAEAAESKQVRRRWAGFWVAAAMLAIVVVGVSVMMASQWGSSSPPPEPEAVQEGGSDGSAADAPEGGPVDHLIADVPAVPAPEGVSDRPADAQASTGLGGSSPGGPLPGGFAEVFRRGHRATPFIETQCRFGACPLPQTPHATAGYHGHGSGVLIEHAAQLLVVTNRHVIESGDAFQIVIRFFELGSGGGVSETLSPIDVSPRDFHVHPGGADLAWVDVTGHRDQFAAASIVPMHLADRPLAPGSDIAFVGHPGGGGANGFEPLNLTKGAVSRVYDDPDEGWMIGTDATLNPGNSGGPAFGEDGRVCGIARGVRGSSFGMEGGSQNFAVDAREIPAAIAGGVPFDPSTMIESQGAGFLADQCPSLEDWPLTGEEVDLLEAVVAEQWQLVGCERLLLQAGDDADVDLARVLGGDTTDEILVVVSPRAAIDADLRLLDGQGRVLDSDVRADDHAWAKCLWPSAAGEKIVARVRNAGGTDAAFLVMVFK